jgi:hypothetical protein
MSFAIYQISSFANRFFTEALPKKWLTMDGARTFLTASRFEREKSGSFYSMNGLKRTPERDLPKLLNEIPPEKLEQILDIFQDLKDKAS